MACVAGTERATADENTPCDWISAVKTTGCETTTIEAVLSAPISSEESTAWLQEAVTSSNVLLNGKLGASVLHQQVKRTLDYWPAE